MKTLNLVLKRIFDIIASAVFLIILIPVMIVIALIIKCTSKGPVFFNQIRVGKNKKEWSCTQWLIAVISAKE